MSIAVPLEELAARLADYPWGYLVTVRDDGRAQTLAIPTQLVDGVLVASVGRRTAENIGARPQVTLVFPGADGTAYSLIVDGDAKAYDDHVEVTPTWAVMHRPALRTD
jgi:general stress protein 26